jgi:hypothetical protein
MCYVIVTCRSLLWMLLTIAATLAMISAIITPKWLIGKHWRMARGGQGLPNVKPWPAIRDPSTPMQVTGIGLLTLMDTLRCAPTLVTNQNDGKHKMKRIVPHFRNINS